jgi:uncharacterized membrane protein YfcA
VEELTIPLWALAGLFLVVSFAYSTVGLGGGSSYTALMAVFSVAHEAIRTVSLSLNLLVTLVASINFMREGHARPRLILPFLLTSMPMAYVGGALKVPVTVFNWLLLISLIFVALRIYLWNDTAVRHQLGRKGQILLSLGVGAALGLLSGIVGIGGGIYLVPLIIVLGLGSQKEASACGALFIWVNSLSSLTARLQHHRVPLTEMIPLLAVVLIGGTLGSYVGSSRLSPKTMERWLGGIILLAIVFLAKKILTA